MSVSLNQPLGTDFHLRSKINENTQIIEDSINTLDEVSTSFQDRYNYKYIVLTDDDSKESTYTVWYPLLTSYGIQGSVSAIMISSDYPGNATTAQLLEMQTAGFDIMNHSSSGDTITTANMETIIPYSLGIAETKGYIAAQEIFVYPNGNDDDEVEAYVAGLFISALGITGTGNSAPYVLSNMHRINVDDSQDLATITAYVYSQLDSHDMVILANHSYNGVTNLTAILDHYDGDSTVRFITMRQFIHLFDLRTVAEERRRTFLLETAVVTLNSIQLTEDKTLYVSNTGSDTTGDGSESLPYATPNKALEMIPNNLNGFTATIMIAAGTYASFSAQDFFGGTLVLNVDTSTTVNFIGYSVINNCSYVLITGGGVLNITETTLDALEISQSNVRTSNIDLELDAVAGTGLYVQDFAKVIISKLIVDNCLDAILVEDNSKLELADVEGTGNTVGFHSGVGGLISFITSTLTATTLYQIDTGSEILNNITTTISNINLTSATTHIAIRRGSAVEYKLEGVTSTWTAGSTYQVGALPAWCYPSDANYKHELKLSYITDTEYSGLINITTAGLVYITPRSAMSSLDIQIDVTFIPV